LPPNIKFVGEFKLNKKFEFTNIENFVDLEIPRLWVINFAPDPYQLINKFPENLKKSLEYI